MKALLFLLLLIACQAPQAMEPVALPEGQDSGITPPPVIESVENMSEIAADTTNATQTWKETPLKDVLTGTTFIISQFNKPVILESFAVWCPVCTEQQEKIKQLHEQIGNEAVSISLDTDPNEDEEKVKIAAQRRGHTWRFAVSPPEVTKQLIEEFGTSVVSAPNAPIIVICPDGSASLLPSGVKSVIDLKRAVNDC